MPSLLKMPALQVTPDYVDAFFRANNSFLYQLVFDPVHRKLVPLNPYPDDVNPAELRYAGPYPFSCPLSLLWSPYVIGQTIIFSSCFFLSSSSFFFLA